MPSVIQELLSTGYEARRAKRLADAKATFSQAVAESRQVQEPLLLAQSLTGLGQIERDLGDNEAALKWYASAVDIYRHESVPLKLAHTIRHVADILRNESRLQESRVAYEEALAIYRKHAHEANSLDLANALRGFALLASEESRAYWMEAKGFYAACEVKAGVDECEARLSAMLPSHNH